MARARPPDNEPNPKGGGPGHNGGGPDRKRGFLTWRGAMASWLIISLVGWIAVAALIAILTPEQTGTIATDKDAEGLEKVAPAAGPKPEK